MALLSGSTLQSLNQVDQTRSLLEIAYSRLSSGKQITRAGQNPAALAIAQGLQAELLAQTQATRNANDGISLVQTAEGGLDTIQQNLSRLRELSVQASSDTLSASARAAINEESNSILQEINRVAGATRFNGQSLLNGSLANGVAVQVGTDGSSSSQVSIQIADSRAAALGLSTTDNLSSAASSQAFLDQVDQAIDAVSSRRAGIGATQNRLSTAASNLAESQEATAAAHSRIADVDFAVEAANAARLSILQNAGLNILAQTANASKSSLQLVK